MKRSHRTVLDSVAQQNIPDDANLFPQIVEKLEKKTWMRTLRTRPALALLLLLLALSILSGVAYAVGRSLGYIPGVGIVEQGSHIRILTEPVSMERDGIVLTVTDAVLSSDKTIILYTLENVPWETLSHHEGELRCYQSPFLHLPDGEMLFLNGGGGGMGQMRMVYPPIPADANNATFMLPCIMDAFPGSAPENWALDLQFKPAPPDITVVPVVEIAPATVITADAPEKLDNNGVPLSETTPATSMANASEAPFIITTAMSVGNQTFLLGTQQNLDVDLQAFRLTDANGEEVYTTHPTIEGLPSFDWGFQFQSNQAYPLTLSFESISSAVLQNSKAELEFDAGENPQPGQEWTLNQLVEIGGRTIILESVRVDSRGDYEFIFIGDPDITGISFQIPGYTALGGGGSGAYGFGRFSASQAYENLPTGQFHVVFSDLKISTPETWEIQWSPENPPDVVPLYGITLQVDQYIPLDDGYYLIGHIEWDNERVQSVSEAERMRAFDAAGQEVTLEKATFAETMGLVESLDETQWVYRLYGKDFNEPLRLQLGSVYIMFEPALQFTFDLSSLGFDFNDDYINVPYKIGLHALDVPELSANVFKVTYIQEAGLRGFEIGINADPHLKSLIFQFPSELDAQGNYIYATGDSYIDEQYDLLLSRILTDNPMTFPLTIIASDATVSGNWYTDWMPPTVESPTYVP